MNTTNSLFNNPIIDRIRDLETTVSALSNARQPYIGDWFEFNNIFTYSSATAMATTGLDLTGSFKVGDKLRFKQGGAYQYAYVYDVSTTTLNIQTGSDYSLVAGTITDVAKGINSASGHPIQMKFNPSLTAIGATFTQGAALGLDYRFSMTGDLVTIRQYDLGGSSVNGACVLQYTLPVPAQKLESSFIRLANGTATVALSYVANVSVTPTNPELYGVIFKDVTENALSSGSANHQGTISYFAQ